MTDVSRRGIECDVVRRLLPLFVDRECPDEDARLVEQHIAGCVNCAKEVAVERATRAAIREAWRIGPAPAHLRDRVRGALRNRVSRLSGHGRLAIPLAAAALLAIVVIPAAVDYSRVPSAAATASGGVPGVSAVRQVVRATKAPIVVEVARRHGEATLLDVASPDRRNVARYLARKLNFPVEVPRFAAHEAQLLGGRVADLANSRGAQLLFHKGGKKVSLFVAPALAGAEASSGRPDPASQAPDRVRPDVSTADGVNVVRWRDRGLSYALAADLDPSDMIRLVGSFDDD